MAEKQKQKTKDKPNDPVQNSQNQNELNDNFINNLFAELEKKGLPLKEAAVKNVRREYIKEKDFISTIEKEGEFIRTELNKVVVPKIKDKCEDLYQEILKILLSKKFLITAISPDYDRKLKYPKRLNIVGEDCCENSTSSECEDSANSPSKDSKQRKFYIINFQRPEHKSYFWLTLIIIIVLGFCMFPIWPLEVKLVIWWISWILLIFLIGLMVIRLFFYILFYTVGYDFWIFPNLNDDKVGFVDSFKPLYSFDKRNENKTTITIRIAIAITLGVSCTYIYQNPELVMDFIDHLGGIYEDVLSWGNEKIIHYHNGTGITLVDKNEKYRRIIEEDGLIGD